MAIPRISRHRLKELSAPDASRWILRASVNWIEMVAIVVTARFIDHWYTYIIGMFLLATRQHALGILVHDGAHQGISRNKEWNDRILRVFGTWPLMLDLENYRHFHLGHHQTFGTEDDTELFHKRKFRTEWEVPLSMRRMLQLLLSDCLGGGARNMIVVIEKLGMRHRHNIVGSLAWWGTVGILLGLVHQNWVLLYFFGSQFWFFWAIFRARMWTEHVGTQRPYRFHASRIWRFLFLPHQTWHHWEHHEYMTIPSWNLPLARKLDAAATGQSLTALPSVREVFRSLNEHSEGSGFFGVNRLEEAPLRKGKV